MQSIKIKRLIYLIGWSLLVAVATTAPLPDLGGAGPAWTDKAVHFFLFGGLSFFIIRYLSLFPAVKRWALVTAAIGASSAYAALVEVLQASIPGRSNSFWDWIAGAVGALIVAIFYIKRLKPRY